MKGLCEPSSNKYLFQHGDQKRRQWQQQFLVNTSVCGCDSSVWQCYILCGILSEVEGSVIVGGIGSGKRGAMGMQPHLI